MYDVYLTIRRVYICWGNKACRFGRLANSTTFLKILHRDNDILVDEQCELYSHFFGSGD